MCFEKCEIFCKYLVYFNQKKISWVNEYNSIKIAVIYVVANGKHVAIKAAKDGHNFP